jgi:hypothetical protein
MVGWSGRGRGQVRDGKLVRLQRILVATRRPMVRDVDLHVKAAATEVRRVVGDVVDHIRELERGDGNRFFYLQTLFTIFLRDLYLQ